MDCVISCQTRLIVIDDLHFVDFRHRSGIEVSNHLKWLSNQMPVTFIYTGVQLAERKFFDEGQYGEQAVYAQTARRATRCPVAPFHLKTPAAARAWSDLLRSLESHLLLIDARPGMLTDLAQTLQRDPPPINYAARRDIDPDTLTASIRTAGQQLRHQPPADRLELLARHFWKLYTGSDIRFAPPALTPATSNEQQHRNQVIEPGAADDDILRTAFNLIQHNTPADSGPLTWQPAPPPTSNRPADHHPDIADADKQPDSALHR